MPLGYGRSSPYSLTRGFAHRKNENCKELPEGSRAPNESLLTVVRYRVFNVLQ